MINETKRKKWIRSVLPDPFVGWVKDRRAVVWLQARLKNRKLCEAGHEEVYGEDYFRMVDRTTGQSASIMASSIVEYLHPANVIDMGCGTGNLVEALQSRGVTTRGLEYADSALAYCRQRGLDVTKVDFTDPDAIANPLGKFDLAISTEVAIQLTPTAAKNHIRYLCDNADTVFFSSPPCANDRRPRSPRPARFWIREFATNNFQLDAEVSRIFKSQWEEKGTAPWFYREPMVFRRDATSG